ncbi:MAG: PaaI family thioesterase [Gammaproteobacteria bacterium]|nr:PaaI family thioesterase [Gammaproteobacteria bacterium]
MTERRMIHTLLEMPIFPPTQKILGAELISYDCEKGTVEYRFQPVVGLENPVGGVQGGIVCAMLDDCVGTAMATQLPPDTWIPTLELNTSFVRAVKYGELIYGYGKVTNMGSTVVHSEAELRDSKQKLLARCTAVSMRVAATY